MVSHRGPIPRTHARTHARRPQGWQRTIARTKKWTLPRARNVSFFSLVISHNWPFTRWCFRAPGALLEPAGKMNFVQNYESDKWFVQISKCIFDGQGFMVKNDTIDKMLLPMGSFKVSWTFQNLFEQFFCAHLNRELLANQSTSVTHIRVRTRTNRPFRINI